MAVDLILNYADPMNNRELDLPKVDELNALLVGLFFSHAWKEMSEIRKKK